MWRIIGKGRELESRVMNRIASNLCYIQRIFWDQYAHLFHYFSSSTAFLILKDATKECL
jgi:hypothetical protein